MFCVKPDIKNAKLEPTCRGLSEIQFEYLHFSSLFLDLCSSSAALGLKENRQTGHLWVQKNLSALMFNDQLALMAKEYH